MASDSYEENDRKRDRSPEKEERPAKARKDEAGRQIYVGNLDFRTEKSYLEKELSRFGELTDIFMPLDNRGQPRGFAFVTFAEKRSAEDATSALDNRDFDGRVIKVNIARPRPNYSRDRRSNDRRKAGRIFITGLPDDIQERELDDIYHRCGRIDYIELRKSRSTGRVEGVVVFENVRDAEYACRETDGMRFERRRIRVELDDRY